MNEIMSLSDASKKEKGILLHGERYGDNFRSLRVDEIFR